MAAKSVLIPIVVTPGEYFDKVVILKLKRKKIKTRSKIKHIELELAAITEKKLRFNLTQEKRRRLNALIRRLEATHARAWDLVEEHEKLIRRGGSLERLGGCAKRMFLLNVRRVFLKNKIDVLCQSYSREVKSYELTA